MVINTRTNEQINGFWGILGAWAITAALSALFTLMILNGAMGCNRIATDNCILVQYLWGV